MPKYINDMQEQIGRSPSKREIKKKFGFASLNNVDQHLSIMEKAGWIAIRQNEDYGIRPLKIKRGIPVMGHIATPSR